MKHEIGDLDTDVLRRFLKKHSPVAPQLECRLRIGTHCTHASMAMNSSSFTNTTRVLEVLFNRARTRSSFAVNLIILAFSVHVLIF